MGRVGKRQMAGMIWAVIAMKTKIQRPRRMISLLSMMTVLKWSHQRRIGRKNDVIKFNMFIIAD